MHNLTGERFIWWAVNYGEGLRRVERYETKKGQEPTVLLNWLEYKKNKEGKISTSRNLLTLVGELFISNHYKLEVPSRR